MRTRADRTAGGLYPAGGLNLLFLVAVVGCEARPAPASSDPVAQAPSATDEANVPQETLGRIIPNLVLHQDSEKGAEFWVKMEVGLENMPDDSLAKLQKLLKKPLTRSRMGDVEKLVGPHIHPSARKTFRQMIRCAIRENSQAQGKCPEVTS